MRKYITSDKVGEFVQSLFNAGLSVSVCSDHVSVQFADKSCQYVDVYEKGSYDSLVGHFISENELLKKQIRFDEENSIS